MKTFLAVLLVVSFADCARILAILPITTKSHFIVMEPLLQALASKGHQVTVVSNFPQKVPRHNYTDIDCSDKMDVHFNSVTFERIGKVMGGLLKTIDHIMGVISRDCESLYNSSKLDGLDLKNGSYDLVIAEMFGSNCYVHFAHKLGVPLVSMVTSVPLPWIPDYFGLPDNPSYIPNYFLSYPSKMSFYERIMNTFVLVYSKLRFDSKSNSLSQRLAENYFKEKLPRVDDIARNSSLLLVNSHFSLSQSRPFPPNVVEVGGIHIKESKPLPQDLQYILDKSPQGVILLSFGSLIRVSTIPEDKIKIMMKVFSRIPQTVLIKFEKEFPGTPKNVIVRNWLPQRDILEHKNVLAFVSHGGLASIMEAVHCGKPVVGVPFFADQFLNVNNIEWKGVGVQISLDTLTEKDFATAIDQVVNNPKIRENMQRLSKLFRDRPRTALETAVYWTEYVLRHKGAPQLRPYSVHLAWYQRELLDIVAFCLVTVTVLIAAICWAVQATRRALYKKWSTSRHNDKKND